MADPVLPLVFTRRDALDAGLTRHQVERRVNRGTWRSLRRGIHCLTAVYDAADARRRHEIEVRAVVLSRPDDVLVSHLSAACLLGWPRPLAGWGPATVTAAPGALARARRGVVIQAATLRTVDRTTRDGLPVTSAARTVADVLRHVRAPEAVAIADHALRAGRVTYEQVAAVLAWQQTWPYAVRGVDALQLVDPRRETWIESYSFVALHEHRVPLPEPQVEVLDARGRFVARLDGLWDDATAAESDGRVKYDLMGVLGAQADPSASVDELVRRAQRTLDEEKRRQDAVCGLGLELVRWGTAEVLADLPGLALRVQERRAVADPARFTGRLRRQPRPAWLPPPA